MDKPLVKITWQDAHASTTVAYADHEIPHAAMEIQTVGWLLKEDEAGVSVANEFCSDATYRGYTFVPRGMIKSVQLLDRAPKTKKPKKVKPAGKIVYNAEGKATADIVVGIPAPDLE